VVAALSAGSAGCAVLQTKANTTRTAVMHTRIRLLIPLSIVILGSSLLWSLFR